MSTPHTNDCPHCGHPWTVHGRQCAECGCYWQKPEPPKPPPPTERDLLIVKVRDAIFAELGRQHDNDEIDGAGYWDSVLGVLDGEPDWSAVAEAAIRAMEEKP